jgi:hypothetical protein
MSKSKSKFAETPLRRKVRGIAGCPYCGVAVNERCVSPEGVAQFSNHVERVEAAGMYGGDAWAQRKRG